MQTIETLYNTVKKNIGCDVISVKDGKFYITFNAKTKDFQILPNFSLKEFLTRNTKDSTTILALDVMILAQRIRDAYGPIGINSSYRSPSYNASIGGTTKSQHVLGNALDTYPVDRNMKRYIQTIENMNLPGGFGKYNTFCHIDVRLTRARWDERT